MADLIFKNPETAAQFEATTDRDKVIHIPGKYSGKLSAIPPEIAQALINMEDNQVRAKSAATAPAKPAGKKDAEAPVDVKGQ